MSSMQQVENWVLKFVQSNPEETGVTLVDRFIDEKHLQNNDPKKVWKEILQPRILDLAEKGLIAKDWITRRYRSPGVPSEVTRRRIPEKANQPEPPPMPLPAPVVRSEIRLSETENDLTLVEVGSWVQGKESRLLELVELLGAEKVEAVCHKVAAIVKLKQEYESKMAAIMNGVSEKALANHSKN